MRLIIVRHGQTKDNTQRILQGQSDSLLNELGQHQADALASRLSNEKIDVIYTSDLTRAKDTAVKIARAVRLEAVADSRLRERSYGKFEGHPAADYELALAQSSLKREDFRPAQGETLMELKKRISEFLVTIRSEHKHETVATVAHAGANKMLIMELMCWDFDSWLTIKQDNASVSIFNIPNDTTKQVETLLMNCTKHLSTLQLEGEWEGYE